MVTMVTKSVNEHQNMYSPLTGVSAETGGEENE